MRTYHPTRLVIPCTLVMLMTIVAVTSIWGAPAQDEQAATAATQWQFAAIKVPVDTPNSELGRQVTQMGRDGWELVTVENFAKEGTTTHTAYYFKRPL